MVLRLLRVAGIYVKIIMVALTPTLVCFCHPIHVSADDEFIDDAFFIAAGRYEYGVL